VNKYRLSLQSNALRALLKHLAAWMLALGFLVGASNSQAAYMIWTNVNRTGVWQDPTSWSPLGPPGAFDTAFFTNFNLNSCTVTLDADAVVGSIVFSNKFLIPAIGYCLDLAGHSLSAVNGNPSTRSVLDVADRGGYNTVYINSSTAAGTGLFLTNSSGNAKVIVGRNGIGMLYVTNGNVTANQVNLGNGSSSQSSFLILNGPSTYWTNTTKVQIGDNEYSHHNELWIQNGATMKLTSSSVQVGYASSTNSLLLDTNGRLFTGGNSHIGNGTSNNTATVQGGAIWDNGNGTLVVGYVGGAGNLLTIGTGSVVGNMSAATVSAANTLNLHGGLLQSASTYVYGTVNGFGSIAGDTTIYSGGLLAPGGSIAAITFSNNLTLAGTTLLNLDKLNTNGSNDSVHVFGTLAMGGTLTAINTGAVLVAGDTFQLFTFAGQSGDFAVTNLPSLNPGLSWDTSQLDSQGIIAVVGAVRSTADSGAGSLRQAILMAGPGDTIVVDPSVTGTITLTTGELLITNNLTIIGPGPNVLAVSGNGASRVLSVTNGMVSISGLTISNGLDTSELGGGGIYNQATLVLSNCTLSGNSAEAGGGIENEGTLTLANCTLSSNSADSEGGGIDNDGTLTLTACTLSGNSGEIWGGGIFNWVTLTLVNCTLSGNSADDNGGGIYNDDTLTLTACTLSGNSAPEGGGIENAGTLTVANTIIAGNTATGSGPDVFGSVATSGFNLVGQTNGSSGWGLLFDLTGSTASPLNPLLGPLADNGGPTPTMALLAGSPAIDSGKSFGLTTDQRGLPRPFQTTVHSFLGDGSCRGAYESQVIWVTVSTSSSPSAGGSTSGDGMYTNGVPVTVTATANPCYSFADWKIGDFVVGYSTNYTFTASGNTTLVANFAVNAYTISTSSGPAQGGSTSGDGTVNCGSNVTVTATANNCYSFVNWTDQNSNVVSTSASYSFTASASETLVANFSQIAYTISTSSSPSGGGSTSGGGTVNCGSNVTVTATANPCYNFVNWTEGGTVVSSSPSYSFTDAGNRTLVANFSQITYYIGTSASPSYGGWTGGDGTVTCGSSVTVTAMPYSCYSFVNWTESGSVVSASPFYSFTANAPRNLVANFSQIVYTINTSSSPAQGGATSGGGSVWCSTNSTTVCATANPGYVLAYWTQNGSVVGTASCYTFMPYADTDLVANFAPFQITGVKVQSTNVVVTWIAPHASTNRVMVTSGGTGGGYSTNNFQNVGSLILMPAGDAAVSVSTNYTDWNGATNRPARYYRLSLTH